MVMMHPSSMGLTCFLWDKHAFSLDLDVHSDATAAVGINVAKVLDGRLV